MQEFRNHSVVVENEVRKKHEELTAELEAKHGDKMALLKKQAADCTALFAKHEDEIAYLKSLVTAQEAYLRAVRHRWGLEQKEQLNAEIQSLKQEMDKLQEENTDLSHQLMCRDELVAHLRGEMSSLDVELKRQASSFTEEKRACDDKMRMLRLEMKQQGPVQGPPQEV